MRELLEADESADSTQAGERGVWQTLNQRLKISEIRPEANPAVIARELEDRQGAYFVLKNTQKKTYLRLSPVEFKLWGQMNGQKNLEALIVEHFMETGVFARNMVLHLVEQLYGNHMLCEEPEAVWTQIRQAIHNRSRSSRFSAPASWLLTKKLSIKNIDKSITLLYKYGGWLFFTRPAKVLCLLISLAGLVAFYRILVDPQYIFLGENFLPGLAMLWVAALFPVFIHELGHALTVKHFGREVPKGGFMLFFGLPAAFVDTTDIWLEPRKARLAVTWNGPYTGLILGGSAALLMLLFPGAAINSFLFKMAGYAYLTVFINVNPLLKFDGYYLLSDSLDIPSLRERSLAFVRHKLLRKIMGKGKFTREEKIFAVFGLLSLLWTIYALFMAGYFWKSRVSSGLQVFFGNGYSVIARILSLLLVAGVISFGFLLFMQFMRIGKTLVSRLLKSPVMSQHWRLALVGAGLAVGAGILLSSPLFRQAGWLAGITAAAISILVAYRLTIFSRAYAGSPRGIAQFAIAAALGLNGLIQLPGFAPPGDSFRSWLQAGSVIALLGAGLLFIWPVTGRLKPAGIVLGIFTGVVSAAALGQLTDSVITSPFILLLLTISTLIVWDLIGLRGSARSPAVALVNLGAILISVSGLVMSLELDLGLFGILFVAAGGLHLVYARLPALSANDMKEISSQTHKAIRTSVAILIRRVIAQTFFESGFPGVDWLGREFSEEMQRKGVGLRVEGNRFIDRELEGRNAMELTEVYGLAFDVLYRLIRIELGREIGKLVFAYGLDLLPWQLREVVTELILARREWGLELDEDWKDKKITRMKILKRVPLFATCPDEELERVVRNLAEEQFAAGETIIKQGEIGDRFYVVERGNISIWQTGTDGAQQLIGRKGPGQFFGEIALVANVPRTATARAETPAVLLTLKQRDFDRLARQYVSLANNIDSDIRYNWLLRGMPVFDELEAHELELLVAILEPRKFRAGEIIFQEGEPGDQFYIIETGSVAITRQTDGKTLELARRGPGEYFGEVALLNDRPRTATVTALEDTSLLGLERQYFLNLMSNFAQFGQTISRTGSRRLSNVRMGWASN
jgi:putative peptide zinc metalloprotease protein